MFLGQGDVLGSYTIVKLLGVGGMGSVYLAENRADSQKVALKVLHEKWIERRSMIRRFFAEAHAAGQLDHENILKVIDFVAHERKGLYFMVMELLEGKELHELLDDEGAFSPARCASLGQQIAGALAAAHDKGIIHRDLKPENLFIARRRDGAEHVKVLDFGVAKLMEPMPSSEAFPSHEHTARGTTLGTPAYMSPEQICGRPVDGRSDIYSLGIILYESLTCQKPFKSASFGELVYKHSAMTPMRPSQREGVPHAIPSRFDELIMKCLAKPPEDRPQTMNEIRDELLSIGKTLTPDPLHS